MSKELMVGGEPSGRRKGDAQETRTVTVLAVDDDRSYLSYLRHILSRAGYGVRTAPDAASAIECLRAEKIDLLLVDLNMPQMDGIEMVQRIQADEDLRNLYSILLTASTHIETKLRALEGGLDDFLTKGSTEGEILAKLRSAARRLDVERRLHLENEELQTLALTDELTNIANRRSLLREADQMLRAGRALSVVLFDLNRFKLVNDTYGHVIGDRILADVGALFQTSCRFGDVVGRYGGDEFVMLIADESDEEARVLAARLDAAICHLRWTIHGTTFGISACHGVATAAAGAPSTLQLLLTQADEELYRQKQAGVCEPERR